MSIDDEQARSFRALRVEQLAREVARSPLAPLLVQSADCTSTNPIEAFFNFAEKFEAEAERRRDFARQEPKAT